jgi:hypothetical protein
MLNYSIGNTDPTWCELMRQVSRLEQMDRFPFGPEAKKDLGAALAYCDSLDEVREVITEFVNDARAGVKCPLVGDIRAMIDQRRTRNPEPEETLPAPRAATSTNQCSRCQGFGCIGGLAFGPARLCCPATWCDCSAGNIRRREEPDYVDRVNECREKLLKRFATPPVRTPGMKSVAEEYHGDF